MSKKQNKVKYQFMGGGQDRKCVNSAKITRIKKHTWTACLRMK